MKRMTQSNHWRLKQWPVWWEHWQGPSILSSQWWPVRLDITDILMRVSDAPDFGILELKPLSMLYLVENIEVYLTFLSAFILRINLLLPSLQSKEYLAHSKCSWCESCIFWTLIIVSVHLGLRPRLPVTCFCYICCGSFSFLLEPTVYLEVAVIVCFFFFLVLPKPWDSRKTCIAFIERKKVYSLFFLKSCPSYPSQQFCVRILSLLNQFGDYFLYIWMKESCLPSAFFAGTSCV